MPKHRVPLHYQKIAIDRAVNILAEVYQGKPPTISTKDGADQVHLDYLIEAMCTIDGLCERIDMREDLDPAKGRKT